MPTSDALHNGLLTQVFGGSAWSVPSSLWVGLHLATTLSSASSAGETSISTTDAIETGMRLNISSERVEEEVAYAGPVSGSGPYIVDLVDSGGSTYSLTDNHSSGDFVEFMPALDDSYTIEPTASEYSRVELVNDGTSWSQSGTTFSNAVDIAFPKATSTWGVVTSFLLYDSSSGGTLVWAYNTDWNIKIDDTDNFLIEAGDIQINKQEFYG